MIFRPFFAQQRENLVDYRKQNVPNVSPINNKPPAPVLAFEFKPIITTPTAELLRPQPDTTLKDIPPPVANNSMRPVSHSRTEISFLPANLPLRTQAPLAPAPVQNRSLEQAQSLLGFSRKTRYTSLPSVIVTDAPKSYVTLSSHKQTIKQLTNNPQVDDPKKKMLWGEPTWLLLHTLAEKVRDDKFSEIRKGLLDIIYTIATNLPCPNCSVHAKAHLDGVNFDTIQTKEQLKYMLFDFHNFVNKRKHFSVFEYNNLSEKYSKAITKNIIQNFMTNYERKSKSIRLIADDLHRQRLIVVMKEWFNANISYFYP